MANRIKGLDAAAIGPSSSSPVEQVRRTSGVGSASGGSSSSGEGESVHITDSARALSALSLALQDTPDIDTGRVAALQQAIDAGQYSVDPQRIADRMLQLEQDLGAAQ